MACDIEGRVRHSHLAKANKQKRKGLTADLSGFAGFHRLNGFKERDRRFGTDNAPPHPPHHCISEGDLSVETSASRQRISKTLFRYSLVFPSSLSSSLIYPICEIFTCLWQVRLPPSVPGRVTLCQDIRSHT